MFFFFGLRLSLTNNVCNFITVVAVGYFFLHLHAQETKKKQRFRPAKGRDKNSRIGNKSVKARKPKEKIKHRNSGGNQEMKSNMVGTERNAIALNEMPLIPIPGIPVDSSLPHLKGSSQVLGGSSPVGKYLVPVVTPHLPKPWISATWGRGRGTTTPGLGGLTV